jgi:hypothetical protein
MKRTAASDFLRFSGQGSRISLQSRLCGGACSLVRTPLRVEIPLTGKNTGNFFILRCKIAAPSLLR